MLVSSSLMFYMLVNLKEGFRIPQKMDETFLMACSLPHTVEEIKVYVQKQCDEDDAAHQEAIIGVTRLFDQAYAAKQALRKEYAECKDISQERRGVIDKILNPKPQKVTRLNNRCENVCKKYKIISVRKSVRCTKKTNRMICVFVLYRNLNFYFNIVFYFDFNE